jgi:ABC-type glutathione transport system ATPase component
MSPLPASVAATGEPVPYLEVRALSKRYASTPVLDAVSFGIAKGEFVCILGPSGCGKTTLLLCLAGLEQASSGHILKQGAAIDACRRHGATWASCSSRMRCSPTSRWPTTWPSGWSASASPRPRSGVLSPT